MWFVNKDIVYLKICFDVVRDVSSRASVGIQEFAADSDVFIEVMHWRHFPTGTHPLSQSEWQKR